MRTAEIIRAVPERIIMKFIKKFIKRVVRKPDLRGTITKIRHLTWADVKAHNKAKKERRQMILEKRRNSAFSRKMAPVYKWMNRLSLLLHALLACAVNFLIETASRHSVSEAFYYMTGTPLVFLYNASLIFISLMLVYLTKRRVFTRLVISVIWLMGGIVNGYILAKRVTPFNMQDLKNVTEAFTIKGYYSSFEIAMIVIGVVAVLVLLTAMWRRGGQYMGKRRRIVNLVVVVVSFAMIPVLTNLAINGRVVSNYFGNIAFAYEDYGFPYCFFTGILSGGISEPNGYSEETMEEITDDGEMTETTKDSETTEVPNILVFQLESFFDPMELEWLEMSEDPIPNFRKIMNHYSSGYFKAPSIGAGTANTEFEVLTGMNLRYFGTGEYPYKTVLKKQTCESAATAFASLGLGTHALHNNGGNFYSRATVFNNIGFDSYTSKEFMNILNYTENESHWAKDDILPKYIEQAMESTPDQNDFVFTVTVQGHGSYPEEKVLNDPKITVSGAATEEENNQWEYFVNMLYETDQMIGEILDYLEENDEPAVVVLYGDHLPTMGLKAEDLKSRYLYNTNYVIWDNIGLEENDQNLAAYQLMSEVMKQIGVHAGTVFNYHQERRKTKNYLQDLELLQYDILYGNQYCYNGEPVITEGHMEMGLVDVTLSDIISKSDGTYILLGNNLTQNSRIYVNGEKQNYTYYSNARIDLRDCELKDGDIIEISQLGSSNTKFRTSQPYEYYKGELWDPDEAEKDREEEEKKAAGEEAKSDDGGTEDSAAETQEDQE